MRSASSEPGPARAIFRLADVDGETSFLAIGVPAAVRGRPQPAGVCGAGLGRRRQPAPLAGSPRGAAAGRARTCGADLSGTRVRTAHRPSVAGSTWTPKAPTTSCPPRHRCSTKRVRRAAAVVVGPAPQAGAGGVGVHPGGRGGRARTAGSAAISWWTSAGNSRSARTRSPRTRSPRWPRQSPADPAARPMGGGGPRTTAPRAGIPQKQALRAGDYGRDPRPGRQPVRRSTPLEVTSVRPTAGSVICSTGRRKPFNRCTRRPDSPRRCGRTSSAGCRGWRSCPRWAWALPGRRHGSGQDRAAAGAGIRATPRRPRHRCRRC